MKELNEQDRERIEQAAKHWFPPSEEGFIRGAEYEHNYQREQQKELRNKVNELQRYSMDTHDEE